MKFCTLRSRLPLIRVIRRLHISCSHATVPPDFCFLIFNVLLWSLGSDGFFVPEYEQWSVAGEVTIQVFERPAGGFRIEEVDCIHC